ncbi:sensor histidine kinase [Sulfuricurvum sp.]|uniref:sensor histidine kinase n=1 Tax=Sulfuricurvum sp. TaxID=2025608 RepID=UPI003BAFC2F4
MLIRICFLLFLYLPYSFASLILTDTLKTTSDFSLSYFYDEKSQLSIKEVADTHFTQTVPSQFALGYKEGTAWFKLTIENKSKNSNFVLYFTEPFWADFDLFELTSNGWVSQYNGLSVPLQERQIEDTCPAFLLHIDTGESKTFYIRGRTVNSQIGAFKLYTEKEFFRPSRLKLNTFYLFYSGVLFIITILNIFLLIEMKERIYAYYIGYVSSFIVFVCMFSGSYLTFGFSGWNEGLHTVGTIVLAFMALFSATFLELKKYFPKINQIFKIFTMIFIIFGILISQNTPYATLFFNIVSSIFLILLLVVAVKTWLLGNIQTRCYLFALIIYMSTMGLMVLTFNALVNNTDFFRYAFLFGAFIEIIFFSLILANRFHAVKDDEIRLQKELLAEKQKNQECLEDEINTQRREIQKQNAILFHQSRYAAMGEMISTIAHQWRQPLNTLALINQNLYINFKLGKCTDESFEDSHHQFNEHLQYMSKTIDDFRNYYKDDKEKQPEDIGQIAELALHLSDVFLNYAKIKTELIVTTEKKVNLTKNEILHVLMNLIKNSQDAIIERNIPSGKITITVEEEGESINIHVCDNAGGIPDEIRPKIFESYFSTKSENGTGLGLYMSKSIIENQYKGTLSFHNTDAGVCFTITLPSNDTIR